MKRAKALSFIAVAAHAATASAAEVGSTPRIFSVAARIVSYLPDAGIETYEEHGSGTASVGGDLAFAYRIDGEIESVRIEPTRKAPRLLVEVAKSGSEPESIDFSRLEPRAIKLATSADGRQYQLNLVPSVKGEDPPRPVSLESVRLDHMYFANAPVILNDGVFVGRLGGGGGAVASLDICGVASVEFSLHKISDWKPWGVLQEGVVELRHPSESTTIEVSGLQNGAKGAASTLAGGPYRVWVNWQPSEHTCDEVWERLRDAQKKIAAGELAVSSPEVMPLIEMQLAREPGPWISSVGFRGLRSDERD
ncbi:hypothetical protein [Botrimarina sp.]|uniref:hypothetical protein n=1 Tax=Botrimarina sp. TaxID=2795802 RepID=UPI0032EBA75C